MELVNVASGKINHGQTVNAEQPIILGKIQLKNFRKKLPGGFHESLVAEVKVQSKKRSLHVGFKVYDTETI